MSGSLKDGRGRPGWAPIVLVATWATDVGAYLGGMAFGRHKLAPSISPGKSWEGAVSACACLIVGALASRYFGIPVWFRTGLSFEERTGELGDLVESLLKRYRSGQGFGKVMPGHGRADQFDNLLFTGAGPHTQSVVRDDHGFIGLY